MVKAVAQPVLTNCNVMRNTERLKRETKTNKSVASAYFTVVSALCVKEVR